MKQRLVALSFIRNYTTTRLRVDKRSPARPPYRPPDPLTDNPNAIVSKLNDDDSLTFIHRQPPTAPSPFSLSTAPVSPLLRPSPLLSTSPSTITAAKPATRLPPLLRPSAEAAEKQHEERERLSDEAVAEIRRLRRSNPEEYTRGRLAKMFGCTQGFVAGVAALRKPLRKRMVRKREEEHGKARSQWGERKELVRETRRLRRGEW